MLLSNKILIMRHGHSRANEKGLILSHPDQGVLDDWGLSERGRGQVQKAAAGIDPGPGLMVFSSDFSRAVQTARIICQITGSRFFGTDTRLRERFFGELEGTCHSNYEKVWQGDVIDDANRAFGCESPIQVRDRVLSLVRDLESGYQQKEILLVSHGDTIQILETFFSGVRPGLHRSLPHMDTAQIRELQSP